MTVARPTARRDVSGSPSLRLVLRPILLVAALFVAVALRVDMDHLTLPAMSVDVLFAAALMALAVRAGWRPSGLARPGWRARLRPSSVALGIGSGLVLVLIAEVFRPYPALDLVTHPQWFPAWAGVTVLVATGEEVFLRGALFDACRDLGGLPLAIGATTVAFALIHVPFYGWHVVPLDLGVGLLFAGLRLVSGGVAAPAIAHTVADLATWWM